LSPGRPDSLRPAEEPSLLHEFNRVRGIPSNAPWNIAIDSANVYWTEYGGAPASGNIMKVPIAGGPSVTLATGDYPLAIATDGASVYWSDADAATIMKIPVGGGTPMTLISGWNVSALALDATSLYWTDGASIMKLTPR
jgi:hypothetical protein